LLARARNGLSILSVMTTWALENAVDTADSMNSRGYGTGPRSAYSNYRLERRDLWTALFVGGAALACVLLVALGGATLSFFPVFSLGGSFWGSAGLCLAWTLLCALPLALDLFEEAVWRALRRKA
jgi:energy-coupling factor transport system permease protein